MPEVHHDRLTRSQSALFVRKIPVFNSKWLPRLSCVDFQGGSLGSWKENTGFQYCKSKEQLLRNTRLLKRGNQWVHCEEIPVRDCVKAKHVRSQTRSANHHMHEL